MSTSSKRRHTSIAATGLLVALTLLTALTGTATAQHPAVDTTYTEAQLARAHAAQGKDASTVVVAHRGASEYAPENTLAAVRLGVEMDADRVEVDVQQTKDHELVIMHDTTLERTTNVESVFPDRAPWKISDFTLAEIRELDAGSWKDDEYSGERVPTLDEVLTTLQPTGVGLMLEAKEPALYPGVEKRILDTLQSHPYWRAATDPELFHLVSFDWDFQARFHELAPQYAIGLIGTPAEGDLDELADWAEYVNPEYEELDADLVQKIHDAGLSTFTWTINDAETMDRAIDDGVDGIVTNTPDVLRKRLTSR